jgi:hypothetical protein
LVEYMQCACILDLVEETLALSGRVLALFRSLQLPVAAED